MATIETEGKNIAEALQKALAELHCQKDEIEYVVLQQPSSGFLGLFGGKPARLRVMQKEVVEPATAAQKVTQAVKEQNDTDPENVTDVEQIPVQEMATASEAKTVATTEVAAQSETSVATAEEQQQAAVSAADEPTAEEQAQRAEQFLHDVMQAMDIEVRIERSESEEGTVFNLIGENLGILIGKHGQTLDSLQYLANLAANRGVDGDRHHIVLDVENYRARREETLKTLAEHLAEKACRIHRDVRLEPMNRHERKIIHTALQDSSRVSTRSEGDEPRRYVVISPRRTRARQQFTTAE